MESAALQDLHFSLYIPTSSWADHVNTHFAALISKPLIDEFDSVTIPIIDQMVTVAREAELSDPRSSIPSPAAQRRLSDIPAADQALSRTGVPSLDSTLSTTVYTARTAKFSDHTISMWRWWSGPLTLWSVNQKMKGEDGDEEDEFLDYDGAKRWLPSVSELRRCRSGSNSSVRSALSAEEVDHSRIVAPQPVYHVDHPSRRSWDVNVAPHPNTTERYLHEKRHPNIAESGLPAAKQTFGQPTHYHGSDVYLEPGISIIRPPHKLLWDEAGCSRVG